MKKLSILFAAVMVSAMTFATDFKLVTSTADLVAGKKYIIGGASNGKTNFISTESNGNNRKVTEATISGQKVTATDAILVFALGGNATDGWTFATTNYKGDAGYLNPTSTTSSNYLKVVATLDKYAYFSISIDGTNKNAVITCTGKTSRNLLRYNSSNTPPMFSCYSSGQNPVYLFVEAKETEPTKVESVKFEAKFDTIEIGDNKSLSYTIAPDTATDQRVSFVSLNEEALTVSASGVVTGVAENAKVAVVVTALDSLNKDTKLTDTCYITVKAAKLNTCAEVNAAAKDDVLKLNTVTVSYVNGANIYVQDASGSTLVYMYDSGLKAGDVVSGIKGKAAPYNGLPELKPTNTAADWTITPGEAPAFPDATAVPAADQVNKIFTYKGVTELGGSFVEGTRSDLTGKFLGEDFNLYSNFKQAATFDNTKIYDVVGAVGIIDNTDVRVFFISATDVTPTRINEVAEKAAVKKMIVNGQVVFVKDGKMFNALGVEL